MRSILASLLSLLLVGCFATSKHVDKGDVLLYKVAVQANATPEIQAEIRSHISEGSAPILPQIPAGSPLETIIAGSGGAAALLYGLYKSYQASKSDKLNFKLASLDREDSMIELQKAKKI